MLPSSKNGIKYFNTRLPTITKDAVNTSNSRIVITKTLREENKLCDEMKIQNKQ